jgi:hypothetical protein
MVSKREIAMKRVSIISIFLGALSAVALAVVYDQSNFSSLGRLFQPAPEGYVAGKDNGPGSGTHHPGENCGWCHGVGGRAEKYLFTMAGTLYGDRAARAPLKGGEIIMEDRDGKVISMTTNKAGNFWTYAPVASDPYTVSTYHGHEPFVPLYVEDADGNLVQPADHTKPGTWKYKTWTRMGNSERPMVSVAGVGGGTATTTRMSCNMHHGGVAATRGALWVGKAPTLDAYPSRNLSYRKHIHPILRSNCAPCHIPGSTITSKNTKTDHEQPPTFVDYSAGLDLMFYEGSTVSVPVYNPDGTVKGYEDVVKKGVTEVVNKAAPGQSLLLQKVVSGASHGGGAFWDERAPDYMAIRQWIAEGARKN